MFSAYTPVTVRLEGLHVFFKKNHTFVRLYDSHCMVSCEIATSQNSWLETCHSLNISNYTDLFLLLLLLYSISRNIETLFMLRITDVYMFVHEVTAVLGWPVDL